MNYQDIMREKYGCEFYVFCYTCHKSSGQSLVNDLVYVNYDLFSKFEKDLIKVLCRYHYPGLRNIFFHITKNNLADDLVDFLRSHPLEYAENTNREKHILNISWGQ